MSTSAMPGPCNLDEVLAQVAGSWDPVVVGRVNDYDVKAVRVEGEFPEHVHDDTDELFLVLSGRFYLDMPGGTVELGPMDLYTVPRGVRHRPRATAGTRLLNIEPGGTAQYGTGATGPADLG
jgi:mannose-6-phosphate isomerase-like protein (cupin superfamily)